MIDNIKVMIFSSFTILLNKFDLFDKVVSFFIYNNMESYEIIKTVSNDIVTFSISILTLIYLIRKNRLIKKGR